MKLFNITNPSAFYRALADCSSPVTVTMEDGKPITLPSSEKLVENLLSPFAQNGRIPSMELHFVSDSDCVHIINSSRRTRTTKSMSV